MISNRAGSNVFPSIPVLNASAPHIMHPLVSPRLSQTYSLQSARQRQSHVFEPVPLGKSNSYQSKTAAAKTIPHVSKAMRQLDSDEDNSGEEAEILQ